MHLIHEEHGAARPSGHTCGWTVRTRSHTALISRPRDGRPFCSDLRGAGGEERDLGSPGVTLRVHAGLGRTLTVLCPILCVCSIATTPAGVQLGSWAPAEGTYWYHRAGLGGLQQTHSSPHPHPQVHGHHVLTLMAASGAQPRLTCLANLRQGPGQEPGSRRPSPHPRLTRSGCMPCSPRCSSQKDPGKVS